MRKLSNHQSGLLVLITLILTFCSSMAFAEQLTDAGRLRKLSLNLRGVLPTRQEYVEVSKLQDKNRDDFFRRKAREYLATEDFANKMANRAAEDFRFATDFQSLTRNSQFSLPTSMQTFPFQKLVLENIERGTWDELLAGPQYHAQGVADAMIESLNSISGTLQKKVKDAAAYYEISEYDALKVVIGAVEVPSDKNKERSLALATEVFQQLNLPDGPDKSRVEKLLRSNPKSAIVLLKRLVTQNAGDKAEKLNLVLDGALKDRKEPTFFVKLHPLLKTQIPLLSEYVEYAKALSVANFEDINKGKFRDQGEQLTLDIFRIAKRSVEKDPAFAPTGLIKARAFNERYRQTKYSKSAALYRIMFCDEMRPIALGTGTVNQDALGTLKIADLRMQQQQGSATPMAGEAKVSAEHQSPVCKTCHRKLDLPQDMLDESANAGTLVFDDENQVEHRIPLQSFSDLIPVIQQQDQYVRCQVRKFWKWTVGEDVPLTGERNNQIMAMYRNSKGNIKDVVENMTMQEEFYDDKALSQPATFTSVVGIFSRCNTCHENEGLIPSFTSLPINFLAEGSQQKHEDHLKWLGKIVNQTKLLEFGKGAKMPERKSNWVLSQSEHIRIGRWISDLARDNEGRPTISIEESKKILQGASPDVMAKFNRKGAVASFYPSWKRYYEQADLIRVVHDFFPPTNVNCTQFQFNMQLLGQKDTVSGQPATAGPSSAFQKWYSSCLETSIGSPISALQGTTSFSIKPDIERARKDLKIDFLMKEISKTARGKQFGDRLDERNLLMAFNWQDLSAQQKKFWAQQVVESYIGSGVLTSVKLERIADIHVQTLNNHYGNNQMSLGTAARDLAFLTLNREEFLTF